MNLLCPFPRKSFHPHLHHLIVFIQQQNHTRKKITVSLSSCQTKLRTHDEEFTWQTWERVVWSGVKAWAVEWVTVAVRGHDDGGNTKLNLSRATPSRFGGILKGLKGNIKPLQTHSTCSLCSTVITTLLPISPLSKIISTSSGLCFPLLLTTWATSPFCCMLSPPFLHLCLLFPSAFVKQSSRIPKRAQLLELLFSNTLLIWLQTGWGPWPSLSAGVYGIRYAWNTFDLTEGFSHVFPTVPMVCGFKQILWVCVCLCVCVYAALYVCVARRCMTWPEILCYNLQWNVRRRDGEERQRVSEADEKQRWKERGNNNSRQ